MPYLDLVLDLACSDAGVLIVLAIFVIFFRIRRRPASL